MLGEASSLHEDDSLEDKNGSWGWCDLTMATFNGDMIKRIEVFRRKFPI